MQGSYQLMNMHMQKSKKQSLQPNNELQRSKIMRHKDSLMKPSHKRKKKMMIEFPTRRNLKKLGTNTKKN